jgi:hypothetical protein
VAMQGFFVGKMENVIMKTRCNINEELSEKITLTHTQGVYFLFNVSDELLYIGQSENIENRIQSHKFKFKDVSWYRYIECHNPVERIALESDLIWKYNPPYNTTYPVPNGYISINQLRKFYDKRRIHKFVKDYPHHCKLNGLNSIILLDEFIATHPVQDKKRFNINDILQEA